MTSFCGDCRVLSAVLLAFATFASSCTPAPHPRSAPAATGPTSTSAQPPVVARAVPEKDSEPPTAPEPAQAASVAENTWKRLVADQLVGEGLAEARIAPPSQPPICDADCHWQFVVTDGEKDDRRVVGTLHVNVETNEVLWEPNDGRNKRRPIEAHATYERSRRRVVHAVAGLPEVKRHCERLRKQHQLDCALWAEEEPENTECAPKPTVLDPCLWPVYLGELNVGHAVRHATLYVDANKAVVIGAAPMACGPMPLSKWRSYVAKEAAGKLPQCPDEDAGR